MGLKWLSVAVVSVLASDPLAWPPAFVENVSCTRPQDYTYRKSGLIKLALPGFNSIFYNSVGISASPETGNITGTFGSFYTYAAVLGIPPTAFVTSYDAAASWSGSLDPITANVSGASSFSAIEFQSVTGRYVVGGKNATVDLTDFMWNIGDVTKEGDLSYVRFSGTNGQTVVIIEVCISDVLGQLNWGAEMTPTSMKTRFTISGFPGGDIDQLSMQMVFASATVDAAAGVEVNALGVYQLVREGQKRMAHSVMFEGALTVVCDGVIKAATLSSTIGTADDILGAAIKLQLAQSVGLHVDVRRITVTFTAGKATDEWVWDPTLGSGVPPNPRSVDPPDKGGLTAGEIFGIIVLILVLLAVAVFIFTRIRGRLHKSENAALVPDGQKTYV